jgi:hypothetical protein
MIPSCLKHHSQSLDASHAAHAHSRMHARGDEQPLSNPNAPYPTSAQLVDVATNVGEADTLDTEPHQLNRRRAEDRDSSDMAVLGRLSSSMMSTSTARSSIVSTSTASSSIVFMSTAPIPTGQLLVVNEVYDCPVCTMGNGDIPRQYIRKAEAATDGHASGETPESILQSNPRSIRRPNSYISATWFDTHIVARHQELFRRSNSKEFTCLFCPCAFVIRQPTCSARFKNIKDLLEHLRNSHSKASRLRIRFDHQCPPLSMRSYPRELLERLKCMTGSASALG